MRLPYFDHKAADQAVDSEMSSRLEVSPNRREKIREMNRANSEGVPGTAPVKGVVARFPTYVLWLYPQSVLFNSH